MFHSLIFIFWMRAWTIANFLTRLFCAMFVMLMVHAMKRACHFIQVNIFLAAFKRKFTHRFTKHFYLISFYCHLISIQRKLSCKLNVIYSKACPRNKMEIHPSKRNKEGSLSAISGLVWSFVLGYSEPLCYSIFGEKLETLFIGIRRDGYETGYENRCDLLTYSRRECGWLYATLEIFFVLLMIINIEKLYKI